MKENKTILERFYEVYEVGRKKGVPQNDIDYFEASHFLITEIDKVRKETAEYEKDRIKEKVEDWRRGFSMTCAESDIYEKAHQQILKVLKDI